MGSLEDARSPLGPSRSRPPCAANMAATAGAAWGGRSVTRTGSGIARSSLLSRGKDMLRDMKAYATGPRRASEPLFTQLHSGRDERQ